MMELPLNTFASIPPGAHMNGSTVLAVVVVVLIVGCEFFAGVMLQRVASIAFVGAQYIEEILLGLAANAELIIVGEVLTHLILHYDEQLLGIAVGQPVEFLQANKEFRVQRAKARLICIPHPIEVLAAIEAIGDHQPATAILLLITANIERLHIRRDSDPHQAMLLANTIARRVVDFTCRTWYHRLE